MTRLTKKEGTLTVFVIILIIILWGMAGCSDRIKATKKLRRSEKLRKEAIALGAEVHPDTIWKTLEIPVPVVQKDTIFKAQEGDTIWVREDRLTIRYVNLPGDTVELWGECAADTIIKEVPYTITQKITVPVKDNKWKWIAIGLGVVLIASIALRKLVS